MISNSSCDSICDWSNPDSAAELEKLDEGTEKEFEKPLVTCLVNNDEKEIIDQTAFKETAFFANVTTVENR